MKLFLFICVIGLCVCFVYGRVNIVQAHNTRTEMGIFTGKIDNVQFLRKRGKVISYLGIPYAESPTGWKRLRKPRYHGRLTWSYNATYHRPACLQLTAFENKYPTSEDCLFLNIYAPIDSTINPEQRFPVIIYIHGGNFISGSSRDVSPEVFVLANDVIVVTMNYRLGVFGFFSNGFDTYGNYGLWDQHFAIKWVRYNIEFFGGDVENIAIMGNEAGAASVLYQAMYPGNRKLFQRVIALDGSNLSPWALQSSRVRDIGLQVECFKPGDTVIVNGNQSLAECVRQKPPLDLLHAAFKVGHMAPTIDGEFIVDHSYHTLYPVTKKLSDSLDFFYSLDIVIGTVKKHDRRRLFDILASTSKDFDFVNREPTIDKHVFETSIVPSIMKPLYENWGMMLGYPVLTAIRNKVDQAVLFQYSNWTDPFNNYVILNNSLQLSTDVNYLVPAIHVADAHISTTFNTSTYMVNFAYMSSLPGSRKPDLTVMELLGFGPQSIVDKLVNNSELNEVLVQQSMAWINNFVRNGDPNSQKANLLFPPLPRWERYDINRTFLEFSANSTMLLRLGEPSTTFWTSLIPVLLQDNTTFAVVNPVPFGFAESIYIATFRVPAELAEYLIIALTVGCSLLLLLLFVVTCTVCQLRRTQRHPLPDKTVPADEEINRAFSE